MSTKAPTDQNDNTQRRKSRGPIGGLIDLFSSVRFGIVLLVILFLYSTIGSAGVLYPVDVNIFDGGNWRHEFPRAWRGLEMTEFEWFHTWFFNAVIALICANIIITTLRKIRLNVVNLGVWMIHTGIIVLAIGSVIYFSLKVEGDTPVVRRQVRIGWSDASFAPVTLLALPGTSTSATGPNGQWMFRVANIDPQWPIMSEEHAGEKVYSVSVMVQPPGGEPPYIRQLLAGYPQYTEDVIPGKGRVKKQAEFGGRAIIDESLAMSLEYATRDQFWVMSSAALYAREAGGTKWVQRPIKHMPRYNDYLPSVDDAYAVRAGEVIAVDPLNIPAQPPVNEPEAAKVDPLAGYDVRVVGFLRYAAEREGFVEGSEINPMVDARLLHRNGRSDSVRLLARDPARSTAMNGAVAFRWEENQQAIDALESLGKRSLRIKAPGMNEPIDFPITGAELGRGEQDEGPFRAIGTSGWSFRASQAWDNLDMAGGQRISVLVVEFRGPNGEALTRWVADHAPASKDVSPEPGPEGHPVMIEPDARIEALYAPRQMPAILFAASPGNPKVTVYFGEDEQGNVRRDALEVGKSVQLSNDLVLTLTNYIERAKVEIKPAIVPREQRQKDVDDSGAMSLAMIEIRKGDWSERKWASFHRYSYDDSAYAQSGYSPMRPAVFTLDDGRKVEVLFSRQRRPLPHQIALEQFILTEHVGGFEVGRMGGIRDWTSAIRFSRDEGKTWSEPRRVSTNKPTEMDGWWYFQSYWDPPKAAQFAGGSESRGLNLTGLGVGNRHGVYIQLVGCVISVVGMLYAFYVKPIIKRKRRERVMADLAAGRLKPREVDESELVVVANGHASGGGES